MKNCEKCGKPMDMYYNPWCPRCDKPEIRTVQVLNFIQALRHLEAIGYYGIKDRIGEILVDRLHNDSYIDYAFPEEDEVDGEYLTKEMFDDLMVLKNTFGLGDSIVFEVSW